MDPGRESAKGPAAAQQKASRKLRQAVPASVVPKHNDVATLLHLLFQIVLLTLTKSFSAIIEPFRKALAAHVVAGYSLISLANRLVEWLLLKLLSWFSTTEHRFTNWASGDLLRWHIMGTSPVSWGGRRRVIRLCYVALSHLNASSMLTLQPPACLPSPVFQTVTVP